MDVQPHVDLLRDKEALVRASGYPYQRYVVRTADGYLVELERLPRPEAARAALFVHGIFDNAFAWIATGTTSSGAFRAYDSGFDVWMVNLRGNSPHSVLAAAAAAAASASAGPAPCDAAPSAVLGGVGHLAEPSPFASLSSKSSRSSRTSSAAAASSSAASSSSSSASSSTSSTLSSSSSSSSSSPSASTPLLSPKTNARQYWGFSINEHAFQDLPACVAHLRATKATEGIAEPDLRVCAHSMGAAIVLMYLIWERLHGRPHHVSRAVLLSPAGVHEQVSTPMWLLARPLSFGIRCGELLGFHRMAMPAFVKVG